MHAAMYVTPLRPRHAVCYAVVMNPADPERPTRTRRNGIERAIGVDMPKHTIWHRMAGIMLAILAYPGWLGSRTLRRWLLAHRVTSWKRAGMIAWDAFDWPVYALPYTMLAVPLVLAMGWVQRRFGRGYSRRNQP